MHMTYDADADAIYIRFRQAKGQIVSRPLDRSRYVEVDDEGEVGVELLFVSRGVDLTGLPRREEIAGLLDAIPRPV